MYKIKEVSRRTNISISTLRYYEELGLLKPSRTETNYRIYSEKDIEWLFFIKRIKETGMKLKQIQRYSDLRNIGSETIPERIDMLDIQKNELINQINEIQKDIGFIEKKRKTYQNMLDNE